MAFPSEGGSRAATARVWLDTRNAARMVKAQANTLNTASAAGPISAKDVLDFATTLADAIDRFNAAKVVPGIAAFAQNQLNDATVDIVTEFNNMVTGCVNVRDWIVNNFPKDASGYLLFISFTAAGRYAYRQFSSTQTAGMRTQLATLIAAID